MFFILESYNSKFPFDQNIKYQINLFIFRIQKIKTIYQLSSQTNLQTVIMYTRQSWGGTLKSQQQQTLMQSFISTVSSQALIDKDKDYVTRQLYQIDRRISNIHAHQYYDPNLVKKQIQPYFNRKRKLSLPKNNSLTDSMIKSSLGFDQKYAKSYAELLQKTQQQGQKQKRIQQIKKKFTQANTYKDVSANIKPHYRPQIQHHFRPVVDNQRQGYLKTQLIFLQKPNNSKLSQKQYFDKHTDKVATKIFQLGGMQDVLGKMQNSLSENQIKSFKKKEVLEQQKTSPMKNPFYMTPKKSLKNTPSQISQKSWLDRSRVMREHFKNKFHI